MNDHENSLGDIRYYALQTGTVVERKDPEKLGRVKVNIPGLCEPSTGWAYPIGAPGGGAKQRGMKWVPPLGAEVAVLFKGGDPDSPRYMPAHWGAPGGVSEIPTDAAGQERSEDIHVTEYERYIVTVNEIPGKRGFHIRDKVSGDGIEFDAEGPGIIIRASASCEFIVDGAFVVDASMVVLNKRKLSDGTQSF